MKIARIVYDWPPPWQGLAPHPYEVTVSQVKLGHDIHVFCGRWPSAGPIEQPKGVTVHPIFREPLPGTIDFTSSVALFFKYLSWRKTNMDVDIIHCHGHFAIWIYAYRAFLQKYFPWAQELKTPLIAHFHNTVRGRQVKLEGNGSDINPQSKYVSWPLEEFSDRTATKVAAACIFVSNDTKAEAEKYYGADPKRCFVVETGVNAEMFKPVGQEERDKTRYDLGYDMFDKVILVHGTMTERKNIHLIVEALADLPEIYKLLLVGPWDNSYAEKVQEIIEKNHLADRILKVGYTPYPQVPIAFHNADIFVLPSSFEGLQKVVMQALAAEVPCLVSGFKVSEEISGLYYITDLSPKAIADQIVDVMTHPTKVDVEKISRSFSWDYKVRQIEGIYEFAKKNYLR